MQVTTADGICTLTMNRPEARNALSDEMRTAFAEVVPRLASDDAIRAVILTGAGGAFSAGGDIGQCWQRGAKRPPRLAAGGCRTGTPGCAN